MPVHLFLSKNVMLVSDKAGIYLFAVLSALFRTFVIFASMKEKEVLCCQAAGIYEENENLYRGSQSWRGCPLPAPAGPSSPTPSLPLPEGGREWAFGALSTIRQAQRHRGKCWQAVGVARCILRPCPGRLVRRSTGKAPPAMIVVCAGLALGGSVLFEKNPGFAIGLII